MWRSVVPGRGNSPAPCQTAGTEVCHFCRCCFLGAQFATYLLDVGLKQQLGPHGLGAAPAPAHVVADVRVAPGELLWKDC